jgi:hypothetical protein
MENRNGFYICINDLLISITFSAKTHEDMPENEATSNEVLFDRIDYFSSSTDQEGKITLRYQLHRSAPEESVADATPNRCLSEPSEMILSAEEEEMADQIARDVMNVGMKTDTDMNIEETTIKKRKSDKVIEELMNAGKNVSTPVNDIEVECQQSLRDTDNSIHRMKAAICSSYLNDGNSADAGINRSMMKSHLLEMIREFIASLGPEHPWPTKVKSANIMLMANLARDIEEDLRTPVITAAMPKADPVSQKESYKQRLEEMLEWSAAYIGVDKTDRSLGFAGQRLKPGNIRRLSPPDAEQGELPTFFLVRGVEKTRKSIHELEAILNKIKNEAAPQTGVDAATRNVIKDINDELTEFIERWHQPVSKDKLITAPLLPGFLPNALHDFTQARERINTWLNERLSKASLPSDVISESIAKPASSKYKSEYGTVIFHSDSLNIDPLKKSPALSRKRKNTLG